MAKTLKLRRLISASKKNTASEQDSDDMEFLFPIESSETEEDLHPKKVHQAVTWTSDWTTETIVLQLRRGTIDLDPSFQRRDAWRQSRKSRFIESLILGLPIPQIVLAEKKDKRGEYIVIDGKQRLLTLAQFCHDPASSLTSEPLVLSQLLVETELNGKTYKDLTETPSLNQKLTAFLSQPIRAVIIKNWPDEDFLYTVFHRLNSNSVPLSPQELRKALHPGSFIDFAEKASEDSKTLQDALGIKTADFRMRDVEITVRYFAFRHFIKDYNGNLKEFLDNTCKVLNKKWATEKETLVKEFESMESAIVLTNSIFGKQKAFRKYSEGQYERRLNRAVFDIFLFYFSQSEYAKKAADKKNEIKNAFELLCSTDNDFLRSLETSTKTTDVVKKRFATWGRELSKIIGVKFANPF